MPPKSHYTRFKFEGPFIRGYDAFNHIATVGLDLRWRRKSATVVVREMRGSAATLVLDLACGTGDMARAIAQVAPGARVIGSDPSQTMLFEGRDKLSDWNGRIAMVRAVGRLPFRDASFAAITCAFGVRNFIHLEEEMREALRLLQPGGWIHVLEFFLPGNWLTRAVLKSYNALVFPFLGFILTGRIRPYRYLFNSIFTFRSVPDFTELLQRTGYGQVRVRRFFFGMVHLVSANKPAASRASSL
ncbi:MAG TPA: ubiquinone/menaquinone biosynthesis methyltransferase [bacterium]|nr:ubiquinone/menaquinone biosynthesis methyltransferase [bacterium]HQI48419.1 ubiquinone/menaquinone biosynthesis methyltransferase [bacterium]HQJ63221.1 ubiquinone/menaquinone biosynthesis methyltransferase [bacterium]